MHASDDNGITRDIMKSLNSSIGSHLTGASMITTFLTDATLIFSILGGLIGFYIQHSQAQLGAWNLLFLCAAALCASAPLIRGYLVDYKSGKEKHACAQGKPSPLLLVTAITILVMVISSAMSGRFLSTLTGSSSQLLGLFALAALALIGTALYREREIARHLIATVAPTLLAVFAVLLLIMPDSVNAAGKVVDSVALGFANSSELALFLVLLTPWALVPDIRYFKNEKADLGLRLVILAMLMVGMYWAAMRMALIVEVLIVICYLIFYVLNKPVSEQPAKKGKKHAKDGARTPAPFAARLATGWLALCGAGALGALVVGFALPGNSFLSFRGQLWRWAAAAWQKRPVLGYGADGFFSGAATVAKPANWWGGSAQHLTEGTTDPHNVFMWFLVSFGLLGIVALIALLVFWGMRAIKATKTQLAWNPGLMSVGAAILVLSTMPISLNILPFIVISAVCALVPQERIDACPMGASRSLLTLVVTALATLFVFWGAGDAIARIALGPSGYLQTVDGFDKAYAVDKYYGWDPYIDNALNVAFVYAPEQQGTAARQRQIALMTSQDVAAPSLADPYNPYYRLNAINATYLLGKTSSPLTTDTQANATSLRVKLMQAAVKEYPSQPDIDIEWALIESQLGNTAAAQEALARVKALGTYGETIWKTPISQVEQLIQDQTSK